MSWVHDPIVYACLYSWFKLIKLIKSREKFQRIISLFCSCRRLKLSCMKIYGIQMVFLCLAPHENDVITSHHAINYFFLFHLEQIMVRSDMFTRQGIIIIPTNVNLKSLPQQFHSGQRKKRSQFIRIYLQIIVLFSWSSCSIISQWIKRPEIVNVDSMFFLFFSLSPSFFTSKMLFFFLIPLMSCVYLNFLSDSQTSTVRVIYDLRNFKLLTNNIIAIDNVWRSGKMFVAKKGIRRTRTCCECDIRAVTNLGILSFIRCH